MSAITVRKVESMTSNPFAMWIVEGQTFQWKDIIKKCGFWFDYDGKKTGWAKVWYTRKQEIAELLASPDVVGNLNKRLQKEANEANEAMALSKQVDAPEGFEVPIAKGQSYLPYQLSGIKYISERKSSLLADDMGVGKTIQAIGLINLDTSIKRVLILCPLSVRKNWIIELDKFLARDLTRDSVNGSFPETDIVACNYDQVKKWWKQINAVEWDLLIMDESHALKNPKAKRTQQVLGLKDFKGKGIPAKRHLFITGTPILNRPKELFTALQVLDPDGLGKNFYRFAERYCGAYQDRFGLKADGATNLDELQQKLRSKIMVRRLKSDVLTDLPEKIRQPIVLPSTDMKRLAKAELQTGEAHDEILIELAVAKELAKTDDEYEAKLKALIDQERIIFAEVAKKRHELAVAKIPLAIEHIENLLEQTDKVVVFAHHSEVLDELKIRFGDTAVMIRSGIKDEERVDAIKRFQTDDSVRIFLGGIKSAGVGITLTASSTVFFVEQDWTPGLMTQAEDRCHRVGQKNSVLCQYLLIEGTHDAKVANKLATKSDVIRQALDEDVVVPEPEEIQPVTAGITRKEITLESMGLTEPQVIAIHEGLRELSALCDGAGAKDGQGFNKVDTRIGHSLARCAKLTPKQAALGKHILLKYSRQLGSEWISAIEG